MYLFFFDTGEVASVTELNEEVPEGIVSIIRIDPLAVLDIDNGTWEDIPCLDNDTGEDQDEEEPVGFKLGASRVINPEHVWKVARMRF